MFQRDNDPKHTSEVVKEWLNQACIEVLERHYQGPDLNPNQEHVDCAEETCQCEETKKNVAELYLLFQEGSFKIQPEACQKLVGGYQKHLPEPNIRITVCLSLTKRNWVALGLLNGSAAIPRHQYFIYKNLLYNKVDL